MSSSTATKGDAEAATLMDRDEGLDAFESEGDLHDASHVERNVKFIWEPNRVIPSVSGRGESGPPSDAGRQPVSGTGDPAPRAHPERRSI